MLTIIYIPRLTYVYKGGLIGASIIGVNSEKINFHTLPVNYVGYGSDGLSYFLHDEEETNNFIKNIMN